jgi:uncharacterized membrane protein YedE/YeeE
MTLEPSFTAQLAATAAIGGALIGVAAALLLAGSGRIAGISGIAGQLFSPSTKDHSWRLAFLGGLLAGGLVLQILHPEAIGRSGWPSMAPLAVGGLLVGWGTQLGNGCTSGHGVCGLARRSPRSLVATLTFMAIAAAVVGLSRHVLPL